MQIKAILECINSQTDLNGNRYWAFRFTDTQTGKQVCSNITGGESNISAILRVLGYEWNETYYYRSIMGKREFRSLTKEWEYAGCAPEALAAFVRGKVAS